MNWRKIWSIQSSVCGWSIFWLDAEFPLAPSSLSDSQFVQLTYSMWKFHCDTVYSAKAQRHGATSMTVDSYCVSKLSYTVNSLSRLTCVWWNRYAHILNQSRCLHCLVIHLLQVCICMLYVFFPCFTHMTPLTVYWALGTLKTQVPESLPCGHKHH